MINSVLTSPVPSLVIGPAPWSSVNLRWKIWRPRRTARNGSRAMMNADEFAVVVFPRPTPICCEKDLAIPAFAVLGARVLSTSCAEAVVARVADAKRKAQRVGVIVRD